MGLQRLTAALRRRRSAPSALPDPRIDAVVERVNRLEALVEGLQDSVYREARRQDERMDELQARTEPAEMAKALSDDARRRGL